MFTQLELARNNKQVKFAGPDSTIKTADQIQKLLALVKSLQGADVYAVMQGMQVVDGNRTWVSKWSIAVRLPGFCRSSHADLAFVVLL